MSHNLNYNAGAKRHAFASAKEIAWHGLGKVVRDRMTSAECIEEALLNYEVGKGKLFVQYTEPIMKSTLLSKGGQVEDKFATYRKDTGDTFSIVGSVYEVIQNHEAFDFFDAVVGERRAIYETAGALGKGETIFITAKLPDHILIGGKDTIDQYLLFTMSHDGSGSIIAKFTPIRVVCNNTLTAAMEGGNNIFKIKHTKNARNKLDEAQRLLAITYKTSIETKELYESLTKIKITDEVKENIFLNVFLTKDELLKLGTGKWSSSPDISTRKKNQLTSLFKYSEVGAGQDMDICKGTAYGVYNSITGYIQNVKSFSSPEKKFDSIFLGADALLLNKSLNYINSLV